MSIFLNNNQPATEFTWEQLQEWSKSDLISLILERQES
jgi:hypothetical protein